MSDAALPMIPVQIPCLGPKADRAPAPPAEEAGALRDPRAAARRRQGRAQAGLLPGLEGAAPGPLLRQGPGRLPGEAGRHLRPADRGLPGARPGQEVATEAKPA